MVKKKFNKKEIGFNYFRFRENVLEAVKYNNEIKLKYRDLDIKHMDLIKYIFSLTRTEDINDLIISEFNKKKNSESLVRSMAKEFGEYNANKQIEFESIKRLPPEEKEIRHRLYFCVAYSNSNAILTEFVDNLEDFEDMLVIAYLIALRSSMVGAYSKIIRILTPINISSAILYYFWYRLREIHKELGIYTKELFFINDKILNDGFTINKETTLEEFICNVFVDYDKEYLYKFMKSVINEDMPITVSENFVDLVDKAAEVIEKRKIDNDEIINKIKNSMYIEKVEKDIIFIFDSLYKKENINKYVAASAMTTNILNDLEPINIRHKYTCYECIKYIDENGYKAKKELKFEDDFSRLIRLIVYDEYLTSFKNYCSSMSEIFIKLKVMDNKTIEDITKTLEIRDNELTKIKDKYNGVLKEFKSTQKELSEYKKQLESTKYKLNKSEKELSNIKSVENSYEIKIENEKIKEQIEQYQSTILDLERTIAKRDKDIEVLNNKLIEKSKNYDELEDKYIKSKEIADEMLINKSYSEIPISMFINSLRNKRIAIVGGNLLHSKLKEYGLDLRLFEAGYRNITYEDISDCDAVLIVTSYVDHSTIAYVSKATKNHNIPIINFNNTSTDLMILEIFKELYK